MPLTVTMLINILYGYATIVTALLAVSWTFAPVFPFLFARVLPDRAPLFILKAGGRIKVVLGKLFSGTIKTRKDGTYRETPGSGYIFKRVMMFFAPDNYGATMPFDYPMVIQALRERGYEINTYEDLEKLWKDPKTKEEIIGFGYGRTLKIKDMQYLWPANDNPFISEAKEAAELTIERTKQGKNYMMIAGYAFLIVIVAYIAWRLFQTYTGSGPPVNVVCQFPDQIVNAVKANITM